MHLRTAIREAIMQVQRREISEYRMEPHIVREVIDTGIGPPGNWETKCQAEVYAEYPLIPSIDNESEKWERLNELLEQYGFHVYYELVNSAVNSYWPTALPEEISVSDDIRKQIHSLVLRHAQRLQDQILNDFRIRRIESPIEQLFYAQWTLTTLQQPQIASIRGYELQPQAHVKLLDTEYRVDFAIREIQINGDIHFPKIAIECDGFQFHDRDSKQFEYEKKRERALQNAGWKVFHFAGAEVIREPETCVMQVWNYLSRVRSDKVQTVLHGTAL